MRPVLLLLTLAACGGPAVKPDAPPQSDAPSNMPDADTGVTGTWIDTYYETGGAVTQSMCTSSPQAIVVDPNTAMFMSYSGSCHADGSFRLNTPALTSYYLKAGGGLFATTAHAGVDLSQDHLGRGDVTSAVGVTLAIDLTNLVAWANGDLLVAFSANTGFAQTLVFSSGAPAPSDTSVNASTGWIGYTVDSSKGDDLQVYQLVTHTTAGGLAYLSLDRSYAAAPFTMMLNSTSHVPATGSDAFVSPTSSQSFLSVDAGSFDTFEAITTPNTTSRNITADIVAAPTPDTQPSPSMFSYTHDAAGLTTLNFGNVRYGDPFPAGWLRRVRIVESFLTTYSSGTASGTLSAQMTSIVPFSVAQTGTLAAPLGPPIAVTLDGFPASTATTVSQTPLVSWSAPTVGVPTDYAITVFEAHINGSIMTFAPVVRVVVTDATSVRIPYGYVLPQRQYVIEVSSRMRVGVDPALTPFHMGGKTATADVLSALLST